MNAIATVTETAVVEQRSEAAAIIQLIERAALNPAVDVDKMERLFKLAADARGEEAERQYDEAMNAAQEEMRPIATDLNNSQTKSKYASYAALDRVLRPIYTKHGFSLSFYQGDDAPDGHIRVACRVARAGHKERPHLDMPADGKGAKGGDVMTKTHAAGAAVTYGKRYLLGMIFNIAVGEDDDGNSAGVEYVTEDQVADLVALMDEVKADRTRFLNFLRIDSLSKLPARHFKEAVKSLEAKRRQGSAVES